MAIGDILLDLEKTLLALRLDIEHGLEDETVRLFVLPGVGPTIIILPVLFMGEEACDETFDGMGTTRLLFMES
jgi:hypothetical protein